MSIDEEFRNVLNMRYENAIFNLENAKTNVNDENREINLWKNSAIVNEYEILINLINNY